MAVLLIISSSLALVMIIISPGYCAPESYGYTGHFGYESQMNLTGPGYGTMRRNDSDGSVGVKWNSTLHGGSVVNYNDIYVGGQASRNRYVDGSLAPGSGILPTLKENEGSYIKYNKEILFGDSAKEFARKHGGYTAVNSYSTRYGLSVVILIASVVSILAV